MRENQTIFWMIEEEAVHLQDEQVALVLFPVNIFILVIIDFVPYSCKHCKPN